MTVNLVKMPPPAWAGLSDEARYYEQMMDDCPICGACVYDDTCLHVFCETHWRWTEVNVPLCWASPGFAGGGIDHVEYRCGCQEHDESGDVAAAR
jgi:hypothetical protein